MLTTQAKGEPDAPFQRYDPEQFKFNTTAELEELTEFVAQDRALGSVIRQSLTTLRCLLFKCLNGRFLMATAMKLLLD